MKLARYLLLASLCLSPALAAAQWQWIDKDNKKVFSDTAPPPEVPDKNIMRRPGGNPSRANLGQPTAAAVAAAAAAAEPTRTVAAAAAPPSGPGVKPTGVDKELEEKTRKAEEAEKARKDAEAQRVAQAKMENCNRARQGLATFDSGIRVARLNAQGEREVMDDKARSAEQQRLQGVVATDCRATQ
ncbi:conserved exported hypothetical protein [Burkholderiales bacterium 8X]|nr:conserved exported hypothetical protein [Burkholderiales bacterium 8X]